MYCSKCGTRVADDDYACYMCGSRLHNNVRSALEILLEQEQAVSAQELRLKWQQDNEDLRNTAAYVGVSSSEQITEQVIFSDDPIEATVQEMFAHRDEEYEPQDNEDLEYIHTLIGEGSRTFAKERKSRGPLIAGIVIAITAVLVAGAYLWMTRPSEDKEEGIQTEAPGMVITKESEPEVVIEEEVKVSMIARARELRDQFLAEEVSYGELKDEFRLIKDNVFDDIGEFTDISEQIERINTSRRTYEKAEKSYESAKYADAVKEYKEVLKEDELYYEKAQDGIERCNEAVLELVRGRWRYEYDARKEVQQYVNEKGFNVDLSKMKIPIEFLFDLKDDSSIEVSVDYDALNEYIDKVLDLAVETMGNGVEANLPGNIDVSTILKNMYSKTGMKDNIKEQLKIEEALDNLLKEAGVDKIDSYSSKDGHLYIGTACMDASFEEETLTLTSDDSEALAVGHYKMPYPIKMQLVNKPENKPENNETDGIDGTTEKNKESRAREDKLNESVEEKETEER